MRNIIIDVTLEQYREISSLNFGLNLSFSVTTVELVRQPELCVTPGLRRQNNKMNSTASRMVSATTLETG